MKYAIHFPNFFPYSPKEVGKLARLSEEDGWDGFFLWDHLHIARNQHFYDPVVLLASIIENTSKIKIGILVSPLPRYHPHIFARQLITLDHLSNERLILGVGLGMPDTEFTLFGDDSSIQIRARKLDEALKIIQGLWSGEKFKHEGTHYKIPRKIQFLAKPVHDKIPIWTSCTYTQPISEKALLRASRFEWVCIAHQKFPEPPSPEQVKEIVHYISHHRNSKEHFDVFLNGNNSEVEHLRDEYEKVGVTWWSTLVSFSDPLTKIRETIHIKSPQ